MQLMIDADGHLDEEPDEITALLDPPLNSPILGRSHGLFPKQISFENRAGALLRGSPQSPYRDDPTPDKWLAFAELCGLEAAFLYPTAGIGIGAIEDPEVAAIMARGYNNWAHGKYMTFDDRLKCVAILPMQDPSAAIVEMKRVHTDLGITGAALPALQFPKFLGSKDYWPVYEEAERLGFFLGIHGTGLVRGAELLRGFRGKGLINHPLCQMTEFASMMNEGVIATFPRLKVGFLEAGCGWMLYMLDRLDEAAHRSAKSKSPSDLVRESSVFVSAEPYEHTLPLFLERYGSEHVFCATDFPHEDDEEGTTAYVNQWRTMDGLSDADRRNILSETARRAYSLPALAPTS